MCMCSGARPNLKDTRWLTPLHRACRSNSSETVKALLQHSGDVVARDKNWQTPLHVAAANNAIGQYKSYLTLAATSHLRSVVL